MNEMASKEIPLKWDVFVAKRQGLTRDLPPGKEGLNWVGLILGRSGVPGCGTNPLSAQAQAPSRPSGAGKQQEPAENEGGRGPGLRSPPDHRASLVARRHAKNPRHRTMDLGGLGLTFR